MLKKILKLNLMLVVVSATITSCRDYDSYAEQGRLMMEALAKLKSKGHSKSSMANGSMVPTAKDIALMEQEKKEKPFKIAQALSNVDVAAAYKKLVKAARALAQYSPCGYYSFQPAQNQTRAAEELEKLVPSEIADAMIVAAIEEGRLLAAQDSENSLKIAQALNRSGVAQLYRQLVDAVRDEARFGISDDYETAALIQKKIEMLLSAEVAKLVVAKAIEEGNWLVAEDRTLLTD